MNYTQCTQSHDEMSAMCELSKCTPHLIWTYARWVRSIERAKLNDVIEIRWNILASKDSWKRFPRIEQKQCLIKKNIFNKTSSVHYIPSLKNVAAELWNRVELLRVQEKHGNKQTSQIHTCSTPVLMFFVADCLKTTNAYEKRLLAFAFLDIGMHPSNQKHRFFCEN